MSQTFNVARHDITPVKSTLLSRDKTILSCDMSFMSRKIDIMLWSLYIKKFQYLHFQLDYFCRVSTYDNFLLHPVYYKTLIV